MICDCPDLRAVNKEPFCARFQEPITKDDKPCERDNNEDLEKED